MARLCIAEEGLVFAVDLSVAVHVSQLVASDDRARLAAGGSLGRALEDSVPHVAVKIAEGLTHLHDHVVLPPREGGVRPREKELPASSQIEHFAPIEGNMAA